MILTVKLVATVAFCLSVGALFGAFVGDGNGYNPRLCAVLGGVSGMSFGLVASQEMKGGRLLDAIFPPGEKECEAKS